MTEPLNREWLESIVAGHVAGRQTARAILEAPTITIDQGAVTTGSGGLFFLLDESYSGTYALVRIDTEKPR